MATDIAPELGANDIIEPAEPAGHEEVGGLTRVPAPRAADVATPAPSVLGTALEVLPGVLRIGAETVVHTTAWTATMYARGWLRVAKAVVDVDSAAQLSDDLGVITGAALDVVRTAGRGGAVGGLLSKLGVPALEQVQRTLEQHGTRARETSEQRLRRQASALLRRSRDVYRDDARHPAYEAILRELAPDEARILVLLLRDGPQPSVDVRTGGTVGRLQSRIVARGLTMMGARASVRYHHLVPSYLNNLTRLGLIWQSPEPLRELLRYQVVEAQPDVLDAKQSVRSARVVRRSIHLTPFGSEFARICFATEEEAETLDFPTHEAPPEAATESTATAD